MRPTKHFSRLHHKASKHLSILRNLARTAISLSFDETDRILSFVIIESQTAIANFNRAYFLSFTLSPFREKGIQVFCDPGIHTFDQAIDACMRKCKNRIWAKGGWNRRDEPPWHRPETLINSCDEIKCTNYADIIAAFSVPTRVFDDITKFRNFYAHRNDYTVKFAQEVAPAYSIPHRSHHPTKILCTPGYGRPQALILDWIDDINVIIELLCE